MNVVHGDGIIRLLWRIAALLFVASLVTLTIPQLAVIAMMTVIGIPLGFLLAVAPAAFVLLFLFLIVHTVVIAPWPVRFVAAVTVPLLLLGLPPLLLNPDIERRAVALTSSDRNDIRLPLEVDSLGEIRPYNYDRTTTQCDGLCLHALLSGSAKRFIVVFAHNPASPPLGTEKAIEFSLRRQASCPHVSFKPGAHSLPLPGDGVAAASHIGAVDLMKLKMANGECLIERQSRLGDADLVITQNHIKAGTTPVAAGFDINADTISASRISAFRRGTNEHFTEIYRRTSVHYSPFGPVYLPVLTSGYGLEMAPAWWRVKKTIDVDSGYPMPTDRGVFLTETLGLNLALDLDGAGEEITRKIAEAISAGRGPNSAEWDAFAGYFDKLTLGTRTKLSAKTIQMAMRILDDPRYPPPPRLYALVNDAKRREATSELEKLAALFMRRARAGITWDQALKVSEGQSLNGLSGAIAALPDEVLKPHGETLVWLAHKTEAQISAVRALERLSLFGEYSANTMLYLMRSGLKGGKTFIRNAQFQHPYLAGIVGLCRAGSTASSALPQVQEWASQGLLPMNGPYGNLTVATLIRLGANADQTWAAFSAERPEASRRKFDKTASSALQNDRACQF